MDGYVGLPLPLEARSHSSSLHGAFGKLNIILDGFQLASFVAEMVSPDARTSEIRGTRTSDPQTRSRSATSALLEYYNSLDTTLPSLSGHQVRHTRLKQKDLV